MIPGISGPGRVGSGVFFGGLIIALGVLFLVNSLGLVDLGENMRQWWPLLLIAIGAWMLIASRFRKVVAPIILIGIGAFILIGNLGFSIDFFQYWPVILIVVGVIVLSRAIRSPR